MNVKKRNILFTVFWSILSVLLLGKTYSVYQHHLRALQTPLFTFLPSQPHLQIKQGDRCVGSITSKVVTDKDGYTLTTQLFLNSQPPLSGQIELSFNHLGQCIGGFGGIDLSTPKNKKSGSKLKFALTGIEKMLLTLSGLPAPLPPKIENELSGPLTITHVSTDPEHFDFLLEKYPQINRNTPSLPFGVTLIQSSSPCESYEAIHFDLSELSNALEIIKSTAPSLNGAPQ